MGNQEIQPGSESSHTTYMDVIMDLNMCAVEVIYKYDLSDAVKEVKAIVSDENWISEIRAADGNRSLEILGDTLDPIAEKLMNVTGDELVESMPEEVQTWFIDSAVMAAVQ